MASMKDIRRVDFGYFIRPAQETPTRQARVDPCLGYLFRRPDGVVLFDTGMGSGPADLEAHYRPVRRGLENALHAAGARLDEIRWVINCHLHFDHAGGNPRLAGCPIFVQATELVAARSPDYTLPELVDFSGARYEELSGEAEPWPGAHIIPTPNHTAGHQSLVVECDDGTLVVAGQAHDAAFDFSTDYLARRAALENTSPPLPGYHAWLDRLMEFDPARVYFAHDLSVWEPETLTTGF